MTKENIATDGAVSETRAVIRFVELEKAMVLNATNGQIIASIAKTETDIEQAWQGVKVVLYHDPNVSYQSKLVGGIRVRAPKVAPAVPTVAPAVIDDDLPF